MLTRQKRPRRQNRRTEILTIHLIKELLVVAAFSVAQLFAIQVLRESGKGELNDAIGKARFSKPQVRYHQMVILGPMLSSRSNHQTWSYQIRLVAQTKIGIQRRASTTKPLSVPAALNRRDNILAPGLEHRPALSFRSNHPTGLPDSTPDRLVPRLYSHIRLLFRPIQMEWARRHTPKKPAKQYHQRHYQLRLSTQQKRPGHAHVPVHPEERKTVHSLTFSTCRTILCR